MRNMVTGKTRCILLSLLLLTALIAPPLFAQGGGVLTIGELHDPVTLEPYLSDDLVSSRWEDLLYNGLFTINRNMEVVKDLASDYTSRRLDDGRNAVLVYLRDDVKWHDGVNFSAADVVATYETVTHPGTHTNMKSMFFGIDEITKIDNLTVQVVFSKEFSAGLANLTFKILPAHLLKGKVYDRKHPLVRQPVGTGPFRLYRWEDGQYIQFDANRSYHQEGVPALDSIFVRFFGNQNTLLSALEQEDVHLVFDLPPEELSRFRTNAYIDVYTYDASSYDFLAFNLSRSPLDNKEFRQAVSMAIDRRTMLDQLLQGSGVIITGPFAATSWANNPAVSAWPYDPEKAKAILDRLGMVDTDGDSIREYQGKPLSFELLYDAKKNHVLQRVLSFKAQLQNIGIEVRREGRPLKEYMHQVFDERGFDLFTGSWYTGHDPDPYSIWYSGEISHGLNAIGYYNDEVDRLILEARQTDDKELRKQRFFRIHQLIHDDAPYLFLWSPRRHLAISNLFSGFTVDTLHLARGLFHVYEE